MTVTITDTDAHRGRVVWDVDAYEVADLAANGTRHGRRGRQHKRQA